MLKVLSDILLATDSGDLFALVLLDLSAASAIIDHNILLQRLEHSYQRYFSDSETIWLADANMSDQIISINSSSHHMR